MGSITAMSSAQEPFPLLIDTDTAGDDITALLLALWHPRARVVGITTVAGNVPVDLATRNALRLLAYLHLPNIPVFPGCARPLIQSLQTTTHIQGPQGLGQATFPPPRQNPQPVHAVQAILELSHRYPGLHILAIGPLTNLATALMQDATLPQRITHLTIMGGTWTGRGNQTPVAEYNIWQDPEAAYRVLHAGWPITLLPWETVLRDGVLLPHREQALRQSNHPLARAFLQLHRQAKTFDQHHWDVPGSLHPDALAAAVLLTPELIREARPVYMTVELQGTWTRGMTVPDPYGLLGRSPNVRVVLHVHQEGFLDMLEACLLHPFPWTKSDEDNVDSSPSSCP